MQDRPSIQNTHKPDNQERRTAMKKIAVGVGALAGYSVLPERWTRPMVGQIALPAHAATSARSMQACSLPLVSGDQSSSSVTIQVQGGVTPAVNALPVEIVAGSTTEVIVTGSDGSFQTQISVPITAGTAAVNVTTTGLGVEPSSSCSVAIPAAPTVTQAVQQPDTSSPTPSAGGEFNAQEVYPMSWQGVHNRAFTWLGRTGAAYGGPIKLVFTGSCGELYVQNPANDFNRGHPSAAVYFCGTKNKPEESNGTKASIFGPTGCRTTQITVYYNK
jgi:hypothetical protein